MATEAAVAAYTGELKALQLAFDDSARRIAKSKSPLMPGLVDGTRLRQSQRHAFNKMIRNTRGQIKRHMAAGGPGKRLKKASAYTVGTRGLKKGTRNAGMPFVKAGKYRNTGSQLAEEVGRFSGFVHHGTRMRKRKGRLGWTGRRKVQLGRIVGDPWMYRRQKFVLKLFEREWKEQGEKFLEEFWEKKMETIKKRSAKQETHSVFVRAGRGDVNFTQEFWHSDKAAAGSWLEIYRSGVSQDMVTPSDLFADRFNVPTND